jgi:hypothetical protein
VEFIARQVKVPAADMGFYEWFGSTVENHRSQVREHLGFRECSVADADKLTDWLAAHVANAEQDQDRVREELFRRCRAERIEPPTGQRCRHRSPGVAPDVACRLRGRAPLAG